MKFKSNQSGYVALLVTSILLLLTLIVVLASSKGIFFQIKVAQNEVKARQAHWKAEGGLECAFSKAKLEKQIPSTVTDCKVAMELYRLTFSAGEQSVVTAEIENVKVKKTIQFPSIGEAGAIKSTSDLVINGSYRSSADPGKSLGNNLWECTSVLYSNYFYAIDVSTVHPHQISKKPYANFPDSPAGQEQKCASTHYSWAKSVANSEEDYRQSSSMDPFKDVFDVPRSEWFDVMSDNSLFGYVPLELNPATLDSEKDLPKPSFNAKCAENIVDNIKAGKDLVWVYGGCEINTADFSSIKTAINNYLGGSGIILVVQDGLLSTRGIQDFTGMLYHFISPLYADSKGVIPDFTGWDKLENHKELNGTIDKLAATVPMSKARVGYYQHGSFAPLGGFVMDAPGTFALFNASLSFKYNRDVINKPLKKLKKVVWKKGSWNDL
nr:hypothetical protein [uncultured Vibrio sp.]